MAKFAEISQGFFVWNQKACNNKQLLKNKAVKRLCDKNFLLSLFIAFFIVLSAALILNLVYRGLDDVGGNLLRNNNKAIYMMEKG